MALLPKLKAELAHVQQSNVQYRSFPKATRYACGRILLAVFTLFSFLMQIVQIDASHPCYSSPGSVPGAELSSATYAMRHALPWTQVLPYPALALIAKHGFIQLQSSPLRNFKLTSMLWNQYYHIHLPRSRKYLPMHSLAKLLPRPYVIQSRVHKICASTKSGSWRMKFSLKNGSIESHLFWQESAIPHLHRIYLIWRATGWNVAQRPIMMVRCGKTRNLPSARILKLGRRINCRKNLSRSGCVQTF